MSKKLPFFSSILSAVLVLSLAGLASLPALAAPPSAPALQASPMVYVVIAVDTEPDNGHETTDAYHTVFTVDTLSRASTIISPVMATNYRNANVDSDGHPFKMSWFVEADEYINQGQYPDGTSFNYLTPYYELMNNWGGEVRGWGDEIGYHHHFTHWDGAQWLWTMDLAGYDVHNVVLDHMILDAGFFPASYRSGWLWSNNQLHAWLEEWLPFDYTNQPGTEFWLSAPTSWFPYHPSGSDYQTPGNMQHRIARCPGGAGDQARVDSAFAEAQASEGPVIYCWYTHNYDPSMLGGIQETQSRLEAASASYDVPFRYATAREAMQAVMEATDSTPPTLSITEGDGIYTITSGEALWDNHPYVAARYTGPAGSVYTHTLATPVTTNVWQVPLPAEIGALALQEVGAGASDLYGNSRVVTYTIRSDLALSKSGSPNPVVVYQPLTYAIVIANNGPSTATGVTLADTLPLGATLGSATPSQGSCSGTSTVRCNLGTIANGHNATVSVVVTPTLVGTIANVASVSARQADPNMANNTDTENTTVQHVSTPAIGLAKTPDAQTIRTGDTATFTLTVANNGGVDLEDVTVSDAQAPGCARNLGTLRVTAPVTSYTCSLAGLTASFTNTATVTGTPQGAPDVIASDRAEVMVFDPTAVTLSSFTARGRSGAVVVEWETAMELDNLGFNLYRTGSPNVLPGLAQRLNASLIPSQSPGSLVGAAYAYPDETAVPDGAYYYWLEAIDDKGVARLYGPISPTADVDGVTKTPSMIYLPLIIKQAK